MVVCEFVVVRDEVQQSQEVAQQPKLYNECPVPAETRGIVTRQHTHIWSPKDSLGVQEPRSALTTSHAGLLAFYFTL